MYSSQLLRLAFIFGRIGVRARGRADAATRARVPPRRECATTNAACERGVAAMKLLVARPLQCVDIPRYTAHLQEEVRFQDHIRMCSTSRPVRRTARGQNVAVRVRADCRRRRRRRRAAQSVLRAAVHRRAAALHHDVVELLAVKDDCAAVSRGGACTGERMGKEEGAKSVNAEMGGDRAVRVLRRSGPIPTQ